MLNFLGIAYLPYDIYVMKSCMAYVDHKVPQKISGPEIESNANERNFVVRI